MIKKCGTNNNDVLEMNRSLVVKLLKQKKVCSRADLAKAAGLTQAAITKIVAALINMGIVSEVGLIEAERGRRSIGLQLNGELYRVIGVKFSRLSFSVGLFDISGNVYAEKTIKIKEPSSPKVILQQMKDEIRDYLEQFEKIVAIGIAVPGPYLKHQGKIVLMTGSPGWKEVNFKEEFEKEFDVAVFIEHDANSGALAEWWFGESNEDKRVLVNFLASEGVGAGIVSSGKLIIGSQGIAGEIGHISVDVNGEKCECGNYGCLEKYCSAIALEERAKEEIQKYPSSSLNQYKNITYQDIFNEVNKGDILATELVKYAGMYIGYGAVTIINAYNPDVIILSDIMAKGGEVLLNVVKSVVRERVIPELSNHVEIKLSSFSIDPILYGAAALAIDRLLTLPSIFLNKTV
ncbi:MAG: ROK family protein [Clostridiaceae bacterium]